MTIDLKTMDLKPLRSTFAHVARHIGGDKAASRYQEGTMGAQSEANFQYRPTWDPEYELYDASRTAIRMANWYDLKDPRQFYYASWTHTRARQQEVMAGNFEFVDSRGLIGLIPTGVAQQSLAVLAPLRHAAWAANMNNAQICSLGYGTAFTAPAMFHAMDHLGVAQYLTRFALSIGGPAALDAAKDAWLHAADWQDFRHYVEDTFVIRDPVELFIAQNLALDGQLYPLIYARFVGDQVALNGGSAVAMLTSFMPEWHDESARWIDSVVKTMAAESKDNRAQLLRWAGDWGERASAALRGIAELAFPDAAATALAQARDRLHGRLAKSGLAD